MSNLTQSIESIYFTLHDCKQNEVVFPYNPFNQCRSITWRAMWKQFTYTSIKFWVLHFWMIWSLNMAFMQRWLLMQNTDGHYFWSWAFTVQKYEWGISSVEDDDKQIVKEKWITILKYEYVYCRKVEHLYWCFACAWFETFYDVVFLFFFHLACYRFCNCPLF